MNRQFAFSVAGAALALFVVSSQSFAQRDAASKILDQGYYFYAGETYADHANDHAQILTDFSDNEEFVPSYVIQEHTDAIRNNIESSKRAYENVSDTAKQDPATAQKLNKIADHHEKALEICDKLDQHANNPQADAAKVKSLTVDLQSELKGAKQTQKQLPKSTTTEKSSSTYNENN